MFGISRESQSHLLLNSMTQNCQWPYRAEKAILRQVTLVTEIYRSNRTNQKYALARHENPRLSHFSQQIACVRHT